MIKTKIDVDIVSPANFNKNIVFKKSPTNKSISSTGVPEILKGDQIRLKQVLINLVKNALKFTHRGRVRVILTYDDQDSLLKVRVADNGKGIMKEDIDNLFK